MSAWSRLRDFFRPPADVRHDKAMAAFDGAPSPAMVPFSGQPQTAPSAPTIDWITTDGMAPSPTNFAYREGYSGHTYRTGGAPYGFEGWGLQRVRAAIAAHRIGIFWESSLLMIALLGFAPVAAAAAQAIAPIFDLDRYIRGGDAGLAAVVRADLEEALVPRDGLIPSPYLPPTLWGSAMLYLRFMGFVVLQHVDGEPDPDTQLRPRYTRIWPPWAVHYERTIGKWFAWTSEGVVEIKNDGKFTLVCDTLEPHLTDSALVAISEEVLSGRLIQQLRNSWFFKYGNPKLVGFLPPKVAVNSEAGKAFFAALQTITGPDGVGALPDGSDVKFVGLDSRAADSFGAGLASVVLHIAMVLVGSTATGIDAGEQSGNAVYQSQKGGKWGVRDDLIRRPLKCIVRAFNGYHVQPWCDINHGAEIERAKRSGKWVYPTIDIPLPRPNHEEAVQGRAKRFLVALEIVHDAYENDIEVTQDWVNKLCAPECLDVDPPLKIGTDVGPRILEWHVALKQVAPDELRRSLKLPPMPDSAGDLQSLADERRQGKDKAGMKAPENDKGTGIGGAQPPADPSASAARTAALLSALDVALGRP